MHSNNNTFGIPIIIPTPTQFIIGRPNYAIKLIKHKIALHSIIISTEPEIHFIMHMVINSEYVTVATAITRCLYCRQPISKRIILI